MIGLSFDLSRKSTGVVLWKDSTPMKAITIALAPGFLGAQLYDFDQKLVRMLKGRKPDWMAYEDARAVSKQHGQILFGMVGILLMRAWEYSILVEPVNQMTLKKQFAGSGKATKQEMMLAAGRLYPDLHIDNHDEADALGVGHVFLSRAVMEERPSTRS